MSEHNDQTPILEARDVRKTYRLGRVDVPVLKGASITAARGEWLAILGASGSGKSTMLHLLGGLDRPDASRGGKKGGEILYKGQPLRKMGARRLDRYRAADVGFVFQFYHLLPELTVMENVLIGAMVLHGRLGYRKRRDEIRARAESLLKQVGLSERLRHRPVELSGGERQRVAVARALVNDPGVLLADEPTGNLDRASGGEVLESIASMRDEGRRTIVMVTHDATVAARADRVIELRDGLVVQKSASGGVGRAAAV
ncbi:MAG: ABC transporter ATP-binding protein [Phycisphaerales bacterium]|nr:ABC transporter ATP-binding protein [Phycisphaerales bacterium]